MAVTLDASTPAPTWSGYQGVTPATVTSAAFSPPAGLIVGMVTAGESFDAAWGAPTVTDSLGSHLTWTVAATQADGTTNVGGCWLIWAQCPSPQTGMTVSVTLSVGGGQYVFASLLCLLVVTGAETGATPILNITQGTATGSPLSVSITPSVTGSALALMAAKGVTGSATSSTAGAGDVLLDSHPVNSWEVVSEVYGTAGPVLSNATAGSPVALELSTADTSPTWQSIGFEISAPAGGVQNATGNLAVTDTLSGGGAAVRPAGGTLAETTALSGGAAGVRAASGTLASQAALTGFASGTAARGGGWYSLISIVADHYNQRRSEGSRRPVACWDDGTSLTIGPNGELYCKFCGRQYQGKTQLDYDR